jgi:hypothetical protein
MKYIITDKNEAKIGGMYHQDMGRECEGKVIAAGHCSKNEDGTYTVWGNSYGYGIESKPEDAKLLTDLLSEQTVK